MSDSGIYIAVAWCAALCFVSFTTGFLLGWWWA